jgi:hypothetical protein
MYECEYRRTFEQDTELIDHLQVVTTINYNPIAIYILYKITLSLLQSAIPSLASNNGYYSACGLKSTLNGGSLPTAYSC